MPDTKESKKTRIDSRLAARLVRKKLQLDRYLPLPVDTVRRLNDDLKIFLTYHSNAIEGNTLSLRETQMAIEDGMTVHGHPLREYLEATNHAEAYQYMTELVERGVPITLKVIRELHSLVMDKIIEDNGKFRTVSVSIHGANMTPPEAWRVESLMQEWVRWIATTGQEYEPVTRAAIAHHSFESMHPFVDGNGRVGRLLLNLMLMRDGYPPALLLRDWRVRYILALDTAHTGNYNSLINVIGQAVEAGLDRYLEACAATPDIAYQPLATLAASSGYSADYLGWLVRQGRLEAVKRGGRWYSTPEAIARYKAEAQKEL